ncbi:hypothetical protein ETB97_002289 [Aspergillus alliaceus]|uniref:Survival Motor Neuron Gemin2-binding domain-containing protein n=1 Tax=Petromyces alliaceus TaxID=209559 RepID=A0A5N7C9Q1_PETAA|nr:uncharacterized protein BDW43DRAFT_215794 [Aspergillus alliaceus]KAB8228474.1 hypothetical protein BDW43DRAFT_215794 [Aspergillus alliaceus]KAE8390568.1 hypothetical protein BDV23DRAFT_82345 [Aspergillus alliaceus]KAF5865776.1 hypothetical protein ETB97_002289 [Aspergillus burnettii]
MGKNKNATKALTQEEIWDDSALVQSWDEAVEEYKLYHSIHAREENVEDALREAEAAEILQAVQDGRQESIDKDDHMEADVGQPADDSVAAFSEVRHIPPADVSQATEESDVPTVQGTGNIAGPNLMGAPMPQAALSQVQDEGLKNLMMSWYFAGYYTGLYEGQQRGNQNKSS